MKSKIRLIVLVSTALIMTMALFTPRKSASTAARAEESRHIDPETSCGPVSLAVVSIYLGRPVSIWEFHEATRAGELGVCSLDDLVRAMKQHGFAAEGVRYDPDAPPAHQLPMVLFVDENHFLTALQGSRGQIVLLDPPTDPMVSSWTKLRSHWRGEAVVVGRSEQELRLALGRD